MKYYSYIMRVKSDINEIEPATLCVCRGSAVGTKNMLDAFKDGYYIVIFEGEYVGTGLDNEDLAIFEKEVRRISIKEFLKELE